MILFIPKGPLSLKLLHSLKIATKKERGKEG